MGPGARIGLSTIIGILVAGAAGLYSLGADGSGRGLQNWLWQIFTIPGGASLQLTHGGASPFVKHLVGGGGPGPAAIQMVVVSFLVWATVIAGLIFICLRVRATRMI